MAAALALQAGFVYAIISGLAATLIAKMPEVLKVDVQVEKIIPKPPPPPPPKIDLPPPPTTPPPEITIQTDAPAPTITVTNKPPPPPQPVHQAVSTPVSIGRPHVCGGNYYPEVSVRLNEEGTATAAFKVNTDGSVSDVTIAKSSGSERLDAATITCVGHWRYKPATQDGTAVETPWQAAVQWKLH